MDTSLLYHQRCLEFKLKELPEVSEEVMSSYVMIAFCLQKMGNSYDACPLLEKAL
jgi:tetratricopeptide (TPR) repeat protein